MSRTLREDVIEIWSAGVAAVDSAQLVRNVVRIDHDFLKLAGESFPLADIRRLVVVGGGKAGAGMAAGLEEALGEEFVRERVCGWVNVPADCIRALRKIHLHAGRPAGVNEPTWEGVAGAERILELVATLDDRDLCIVLLSGGGSALLPAPAPGIPLDDKQQVTRLLMRTGAAIEELNLVRSCLSRIKCGGLLRAMAAGRSVALIISDVIGDPLETIASGPTVDIRPDAAAALGILRQPSRRTAVPASVWRLLEQQAAASPTGAERKSTPFRNVIVGNNQTAVTAAVERAQALGYRVARQSTDEDGVAREVGRALAEECLRWRGQPVDGRGWCLVTGGEPVVHLSSATGVGAGGRNQELVLAAAERLGNESVDGLALLSGGTDGEDGPTDAAGAFFDAETQRQARSAGLRPSDFLAENNSYPYHAGCGGLLKTGPTHTNVMDLRVALVTPS